MPLFEDLHLYCIGDRVESFTRTGPAFPISMHRMWC